MQVQGCVKGVGQPSSSRTADLYDKCSKRPREIKSACQLQANDLSPEKVVGDGRGKRG